MKNALKTFGLPAVIFLILIGTTILALFSTTISGCTKDNVCPDEAGKVSCGYCKLDAMVSNNPNAGKCISCPTGYTCSGDVCGDLQCVAAGGGGGGGGGGGTTKYCSTGNTYNTSSGKCCPNSAPYYYPGTHGITSAGCYKSCPYANDCGNKFIKY